MSSEDNQIGKKNQPAECRSDLSAILGGNKQLPARYFMQGREVALILTLEVEVDQLASCPRERSDKIEHLSIQICYSLCTALRSHGDFAPAAPSSIGSVCLCFPSRADMVGYAALA